jgi:hypothetical protein
VRDRREVLGLLHAARAEHCEASLPAGHDVAVVAEDRQRVRRQRARAHVQDERRELAGNLVHVRDHQQQALGRGERGGERASL